MKFLMIVVLCLAPVIGGAAEVVLATAGKARCAIYAPPEMMAPVTAARPTAAEQQHNRLLASVNDLALYLGKLAGGPVPVYTRPPAKDEKALPILLGSYADAAFGPYTGKTDFQQSFRLVVSRKGVGIQGETDESASYGVYEMLDRLGCRWYLPGELGEVIPSRRSLSLPTMDLRTRPGTVTRHIWYCDDAFRRRNRLGGFPMSAGHALEGYLTKAQLEQHPAWNAEIGGTRQLHKCDVGYRICWANPEVSDAVGDAIIANLQRDFVPCVSVSPGDGVDFCECAQCKALDAGDWDPSMSCPSITDRYVNFVNRVAARVTAKVPQAKLGFLAYVQFTRPPVREQLHPALIPQLAPITYCRAHTLNDPTCPSRQQIRYLLEGWGKASKNVSMYEYYFHLAEVAAPFPAIARNVVELPVQFANHVTMWTPETMPNFESFLPGLYLGMRMSWYTTADPKQVLREFYTNFYGAAAKPMAAYWQYLDDCWTSVPAHAGCGFSYLRRFTPERMAEARTRMNAALAACKTEMERRRVALADASLKQHELFMALRRNYFAGKYETLAADAQRWVDTHKALGEQYKDNYTFTRTGYAPHTVSVSYFNAFYHASYQDMARIGTEYAILTPPLLSWRYAVDKDQQGEAQGWRQPGWDDTAWKTTDVAMDAWYDLGLEGYYGSVWYRAAVKAPALPAGKKIYLWVGATDGTCRVYVNGTPAQAIDAKGVPLAKAEGYCQPFSFDVTGLLKPDADNQLTLVGTRTGLNELGTGGLLGPVLLYREK